MKVSANACLKTARKFILPGFALLTFVYPFMRGSFIIFKGFGGLGFVGRFHFTGIDMDDGSFQPRGVTVYTGMCKKCCLYKNKDIQGI